MIDLAAVIIMIIFAILLLLMLMLLLYNYEVYPSTFIEVSFGTKELSLFDCDYNCPRGMTTLAYVAEVSGGGASALSVKNIF